MKIIFLDIDGVLNCESTRQRIGSWPVVGIDPDKVGILMRIVLETGCAIVLSSTWRLDNDWLTALPAAGLPREWVIDVTPHFPYRPRGEEIAAWLADETNQVFVDAYAILDDDDDMLKGQPLFRTTWKEGLTEEIASEVIRYFLIEKK